MLVALQNLFFLLSLTLILWQVMFLFNSRCENAFVGLKMNLS